MIELALGGGGQLVTVGDTGGTADTVLETVREELSDPPAKQRQELPAVAVQRFLDICIGVATTCTATAER